LKRRTGRKSQDSAAQVSYKNFLLMLKFLAVRIIER